MKTVEYVSKMMGVILVLSVVFVGLSLVNTIKETVRDEKTIGYKRATSSITLSSVPRTISELEIKADKANKMEIEVVTKDTSDVDAISVFSGTVSHYGPDCVGCSGITASGYNVKNTIYYNDKVYGNLRIVAADRSIALGSVLRLTYNDKVIHAIVLDRGGAIGFGKNFILDLLCESERYSYELGIMKNTKAEVLRYGY